MPRIRQKRLDKHDSVEKEKCRQTRKQISVPRKKIANDKKKSVSLVNAQKELMLRLKDNKQQPEQKGDGVPFAEIDKDSIIMKLRKQNKLLTRQNKQLTELNSTLPHLVQMSKEARQILMILRSAKKQISSDGPADVPHTCSSPINQKVDSNAEHPPPPSPRYDNDDAKEEVDLLTVDNEIANVQVIAVKREIEGDLHHDSIPTKRNIEGDVNHDLIPTQMTVSTISNPLLQQSLRENEQVDLVSFGGILVPKKALQSCNQTKVSKLTTDLMTIVFSATEMSESSLTGKIANMHKERNKNGEVRQKKEIDPLKMQAIIGYVQERIQGATEAEIKKAIRGKLKYEGQKQYGVGYKKVAVGRNAENKPPE